MAATSPLVQAVMTQLAKYPTLDPQAVLAVASQEGLGGGIGDNGTSFGPFQLHYGGAYPSAAPQGEQASQSWATSPAGIDYALNRISSVAGGLKGQPAVSNIVSQFERPLNPQREIQGALQAYGLPTTAPEAPTGPPGASPLALAASAPSGKPNAALLRQAMNLLNF